MVCATYKEKSFSKKRKIKKLSVLSTLHVVKWYHRKIYNIGTLNGCRFVLHKSNKWK